MEDHPVFPKNVLISPGSNINHIRLHNWKIELKSPLKELTCSLTWTYIRKITIIEMVSHLPQTFILYLIWVIGSMVSHLPQTFILYHIWVIGSMVSHLPQTFILYLIWVIGSMVSHLPQTFILYLIWVIGSMVSHLPQTFILYLIWVIGSMVSHLPQTFILYLCCKSLDYSLKGNKLHQSYQKTCRVYSYVDVTLTTSRIPCKQCITFNPII